MATSRAQVILKTVDNVPANYVTNSWCFTGPNMPGEETPLTTILTTFYNAINTACFSELMAQNGHIIKWSDLPGVMPNYPYEETTFNLTAAPSGTALPRQVALTMSFQGSRNAGFPQARRRGRLYLGLLDSISNDLGRPSSSRINAVATAAAALRTSVGALTDVSWAVWSPSDGDAVPITNGWVDNRYDIQRRRGEVATTRSTFS